MNDMSQKRALLRRANLDEQRITELLCVVRRVVKIRLPRDLLAVCILRDTQREANGE